MIILCTDGEANTGLGALDRKNQSATDFYQQAGELAKQKGIIINVITIKGGGCRVDILSKLAELTGGKVTRVNPQKLGKDFSKALDEELMASNVTIKLKLPNIMKFRNEDTEFLSFDQSLFEKAIGNATRSTELTFEYELKSPNELQNKSIDLDNLKEVPFQLQVYYTSTRGDEILRVFSHIQETASNLDEASIGANFKLMAARAAHVTSTRAEVGDLLQAKAINKKWDNFLKDTAKRVNEGNEEIQRYFKNYTKANKKLIKAINKTSRET